MKLTDETIKKCLEKKDSDLRVGVERFVKALNEKRIFAVIHERTKIYDGTKIFGIYEMSNGHALHFSYLIPQMVDVKSLSGEYNYYMKRKGYGNDVVNNTLHEFLNILFEYGFVTYEQVHSTKITILQ